MECETASYQNRNGEELTTNFDDYIPQLFIKNICKGRLLEPKRKTECSESDIDNDMISQYTPKVEKRAAKINKEYSDAPAQSGDKSYKCNFCDFESHSKYKVRMHRKTHVGENLSCHLCTFKTLNKLELQQHVKGHIGEKVYKCAYCNFQTLYKTGLKTHLLRHTGFKPFKCLQCDYRAFQKIHVERHSITHSSSKSTHKCHLCNFKTAFKVRLDRHLQAHEEGTLINEYDLTKDEQDEALEEGDQKDQHRLDDKERKPSEDMHENHLLDLGGDELREEEKDAQIDEERLLAEDEPPQQMTITMKCDLCDYSGPESLLLLHLIETHEEEKL